MGFFSFLKSGNKREKMEDYISRGAVVLDVRTPGEYAGGHVPGSKNIPLQNLNGRLKEIQGWNKPVIACCASGMRSAQASRMLQQSGVEAMNGGPWSNVQRAVGGR